MRKFFLIALTVIGLSLVAFAANQSVWASDGEYVDYVLEQNPEAGTEPGYDSEENPILQMCNDPTFQHHTFCNGVGLEPMATISAVERGVWFCRKRPGLDKWRRCNASTGQCIPPDFEKLFQCENALP